MCQAYEGEHQFILAQEKREREKKEREPAVTVREIEGATVKVAHDPPPPPRYIIRTYDPTMQKWCFDEMRDDKPDLTGLDSGFVAEIIDTRPDLRIGGQANEESKAPAPSHGEAVPVEAIKFVREQAGLHLDTVHNLHMHPNTEKWLREVDAWLSSAPQPRAKASEEVHSALDELFCFINGNGDADRADAAFYVIQRELEIEKKP